MKQEVAHLEVHPAENGGVMVRHVMKTGRGKNGMDYYREPEVHAFGADEHDKALAHIAEHSGLKMPESAEEEQDEEKISPGIHKKVAKMEREEGE